MTNSQIKEIADSFTEIFFSKYSADEIENLSVTDSYNIAVEFYKGSNLSLAVCEDIVSAFCLFRNDEDMASIEAESLILDWVTEGEEYAE